VKSLLRFFLISIAFLLPVQLLSSRIASAAPLIVGSYKVTENTDLGSQVRITLEISLINPTSTPVTITRVALPSISAPGQLVTASSNLVVSSHSTSQVSLQFLMSKRDFNTWHLAPHQQFLITLKPSGGNSTILNLPLLRTQG
jgi:hypothetical protein